jgi:hypothetical protein
MADWLIPTEDRMDAKQAHLEEKLAQLLKEASLVAAQLQAIEQGPGTPHYDQIEMPAHEVGQRLSRLIQSAQAAEVAAAQGAQAACPDCGATCGVDTKRREVHSMDGPVELVETVAHCRRCRRSFFPSA